MGLKSFLKKFLPLPARSLENHLEDIKQYLPTLKMMLSNRPCTSDSFYMMCKANEIKDVHSDTFLPFKNCNVGKEVVMVGAGPTLNYYEPIKDAVHIGVNGTYRNPNFHLDYHFCQDFECEGENGTFSKEELKNYACHKFVGTYIKHLKNRKMVAPEYVPDYIGAKRYFVYDYDKTSQIPLNIEYAPLVDNASTIFTALNFALYTHPKKIYIVGCDCSYALGQHFDGSHSASMFLDRVIANWLKMKEHIEEYYPDIKVVSVNPVGLAGLFEDTYTQRYLKEGLVKNPHNVEGFDEEEEKIC